jgi:hypothetical protein
MAHLMAWQQRSLARLEAALQNRQPQFPGWSETLDPESDADLDQVNAGFLKQIGIEPGRVCIKIGELDIYGWMTTTTPSSAQL